MIEKVLNELEEEVKTNNSDISSDNKEPGSPNQNDNSIVISEVKKKRGRPRKKVEMAENFSEKEDKNDRKRQRRRKRIFSRVSRRKSESWTFFG